MLIVESVGNRETIHLDAEPLFERFLATAHFILQPLFIFEWTQFFLRHLVIRLAQILMRLRMRLDIDTGIAHFRELLPGNGLSAAKMPAADAFGVNKHCKCVAEFFHNRPGYIVLGFPTFIESDKGATQRDLYIA